MGKKGRKGKNNKPQSLEKDAQSREDKSTPRITMADLEEMSGSEGEMPPEDEWDEDAKALKSAILGGAFDHLLKREDGGEDDEKSIEEVELNDDDDVENTADDAKEEEEANEADNTMEQHVETTVDSDENSSSEEDDQNLDDEKSISEEKSESDSEDEADEMQNNEDSDDEEGGEEEREKQTNDMELSIDEKNQVNSKALHMVTQELTSAKKGWPWAETFTIVPPIPLPFGQNNAEGNPLDIHDDLKREVAFYNLALEAVLRGREECEKASIPFSRPDDFFAEMVKSDDHMARVKDRLIFETKKIEAVAQRKSNKEHKLRAKEAHANKLAEKSKRKKDHFKAVEEWAQTAAAQRGRPVDDKSFLGNLDGKKGPNKKRQLADKKYGFGGKRGRFKQNDPSTLNDMSGYNPRGNFPGGTKKTAKTGTGANRQGKRARDASRARKS